MPHLQLDRRQVEGGQVVVSVAFSVLAITLPAGPEGQPLVNATISGIRDIPWLENTGKPRAFEDYDMPAKAFAELKAQLDADAQVLRTLGGRP